jgi:hypothetical protein
VPPGSWRWGGPGWRERSVAGAVRGVTLAVADPDGVRARWEAVLGAAPGVAFVADPADPGIVDIDIVSGTPA